MGIKSFKCSLCETEIDQDNDKTPVCPKHGRTMQRVWATNFILKGGGWSRIPDNKSMFEKDKKEKGEI